MPDDLDRIVSAMDLRLQSLEAAHKATIRRVDELDAKMAKKAARKEPDTSHARPITLYELDSVVDGEMFSFTGRLVWSEKRGKKTSLLFKPLDAAKDDKSAGKFLETWDGVPQWSKERPVLNVIAQLKINGKYRNYGVLWWSEAGRCEPPTPTEAAMRMQEPIDIDGNRVTKTGEYIDRNGIRQQFVSDAEAGVDPKNIPF